MDYLSIANEPDWPHTQPSYFLTPEDHAALFKTVSDYLAKRAKTDPHGPDKSPELINSATEFWLAMSEAFNGGANVWMAYDWVYPPRQGGEALIHLDWGKSWVPTRIYHGFRQFASRLEPGMQVVASKVSGPGASEISKPGVKACAFRTKDGKRVVTNFANVQDQPVEISLNIRGAATGKAQAWLTDGSKSMELLAAQASGSVLKYSLPPRGMLTVEIGSVYP